MPRIAVSPTPGASAIAATLADRRKAAKLNWFRLSVLTGIPIYTLQRVTRGLRGLSEAEAARVDRVLREWEAATASFQADEAAAAEGAAAA